MADVAVQVPVRIGYHGGSYLLETTFDMDFLPSVGDIIHPLKYDPDSGLSFEIEKRYWDENGKAVLQVVQYVVDPPDDRPRGWHSWWSDRDGDLVATLLRNGWWTYPKDQG